MNIEKKLESGASVIVNPAKFVDALALKSALAGVIPKAKDDVNDVVAKVFDKGVSLENLGELEIGSIAASLSPIFASEKVDKAILKCMGSCTYNGERITEEFFDIEIKAREDYYPIAELVLRANCGPLAASLRSWFMELFQKIQGSQEPQ